MAKKIDFTQNLKEELNDNTNKKNSINLNGFVIKKPITKKEKVNFLISTEKEKLNNLDKIAKKNNISRNELINQFIDYILENN